MDISRAIAHLFPGKKAIVDFLVEDDGSGPKINPDRWRIDAPIPTEAELAAADAAAEVSEQAVAYRAKRAAEYPPIGDQLGALWKGGADADAMKQQIAAVKAKYPKPGA